MQEVGSGAAALQGDGPGGAGRSLADTGTAPGHRQTYRQPRLRLERTARAGTGTGTACCRHQCGAAASGCCGHKPGTGCRPNRSNHSRKRSKKYNSRTRNKAPQELVKVSADLLDSLVNLAG